MTASLALCLDAPMQSWGIRSRGIVRDTGTEPTKSGIVGLLAAALGIARDDDTAIAALAHLRLGIRVDREGILERDYQVTQHVPTTQGTAHRTVVSERYYLADALFLAVIEGENTLITRLAHALENPHWPLVLGRRAFVPTRPVLLGPATTKAAVDVLRGHPWLEQHPDARKTARAIPEADRALLRTLVDCPPTTLGADIRHDHPVSFNPAHRRFAPRSVLPDTTRLTDSMIPAEAPSCS
jgi:CRISPR system Cascade subunit CasD